MKSFLILILLLPITLNSQWRTRTGSNKFDGNYKYAYVIGAGSEWPYKNPTFEIICWDEDKPKVYISNIRYTGCEDASFEITFNNTKEIHSYDATPSIDKDAAFIDFSRKYTSWNKNISMVELMELLKKKNRMYLRYEDNCGAEYYEFSLNGSTKAIEFVGKEYFEKESMRLKEEKELEELRLKEEKELAPIRAEIARKEQEEQKLLQLQIENKRIEKFEKDLLYAFQFGDLPMGQSPLKELFKFKFENSTSIRYCTKQDSRGKIFRANEKTFFNASVSLTFYNRIMGDCILMTDGEWGKRNTTRYYVNIDDLVNNTDNPKIQLIKEKWDELVNLSTRN